MQNLTEIAFFNENTQQITIQTMPILGTCIASDLNGQGETDSDCIAPNGCLKNICVTPLTISQEQEINSQNEQINSLTQKLTSVPSVSTAPSSASAISTPSGKPIKLVEQSAASELTLKPIKLTPVVSSVTAKNICTKLGAKVAGWNGKQCVCKKKGYVFKNNKCVKK